jgi:hypothetical protein
MTVGKPEFFQYDFDQYDGAAYHNSYTIEGSIKIFWIHTEIERTM